MLLLGDRLQRIREFRRLRSFELAQLAGVSRAEVSLLESNKRVPQMDTLQRIAAALEVTTSYLIGEMGANLPLSEALSRQSLLLFLESITLDTDQRIALERVSGTNSAPTNIKGWADLLSNVANFRFGSPS